MNFKLKSKAFNNNEMIPAKYSCDGENIFPPLEWQHPPAHTKSFVLLVDDYDAPNGLWNHGIIYNIPAKINKLEEALTSLEEPAKFGENSWGKREYSGPCPPSGEHSYHFKLFALDDMLKFHNRAARTNIEHAMKIHIISEALLIGKYSRNKE